MPHPIIGWERETPVLSGHQFNEFLACRDGQLYFENIPLVEFFDTGHRDSVSTIPRLDSPLEVVYLPKIRHKIEKLKRIFAQVIADIGYAGQFHYAYASKANAAEEVIRTTLGTGAHHEMSSKVDVDIARLMKKMGRIPDDRMILANGFKPNNLGYANSLLALKNEHENLIPVIEDVVELTPFLNSSLTFEMGLRQKSYGDYVTEGDMEQMNSRFGMNLAQVQEAAEIIATASNLSLKLYHAMIGSQITDPARFVARLRPAIEIYARLRKQYPTLSIFNFGGGMPTELTLDFTFDYQAFARHLLTTFQTVCAEHHVLVPDVMGEFGRYTTAEHGMHLFKVIAAKDNGSDYPWYIIDGSIMSSFPDSWALDEHFIVLPLNHLDKSFRRVQLGGITCDSDDVYPPKSSQVPLYLPVETDDLYLGFFCVGAYQEMLGGVRGSKHCVLPEATEVIIDINEQGQPDFQVVPGQTTADVLHNLGYQI